MRTGIVKDARFTNHNQGPGHVESPERIEALNRMVEEEVRFPYMLIEPRLAGEREIELIHTPDYVRLIRSTAGREHTALDADTSASPLSWETARLAAGAAIQAAGSIREGKIQNALALVRPPGHHAEADAARGFCLFNNIAIAAEYLVHDHGLKRVLIVDWDLHHGNGTQHAFYARRDVLFFSTHQYPLYPGTGHWSEIGEGPGEGFTLNVPLSPGKTDADYLFIYRKLLAPAARRFRPEFILVSAGFDIYGGDPLGGMDISPLGFGAMTAELVGLAEEFCGGRLLIILEGGYSLPGLRQGAKEVLLQMSGTGAAPTIKAQASADTKQELAPIVQFFKKYWDIES
ncbi:MAG: histone deacetylase [Candidatus Aminicenantes bacterium]|nr:histone deacetylase [Candidatus Aminicenantes bacterium]